MIVEVPVEEIAAVVAVWVIGAQEAEVWVIEAEEREAEEPIA